MLVFRAINKIDLEKYNSNTDIESTMVTTFLEVLNDKKTTKTRKEKDILLRGRLLFKDKRANALDAIIGHISGFKLKSKKSPWISVSSDLAYVESEYAIPQAGKYNYQHERKPIIVINVDENKVYDTVEKVRSLRNNSTENDIVIDLRNGKLSEYFDSDAIMCEKLNMDLPNYDIVYDINKNLKYKTKVDGFSNFATDASELLIYGLIDRKSIEFVLYPLLQDILYSCNKTVNNNTKNYIKDFYKYLDSLYNEMNELYAELYPSIYEGVNLTDYLINNYNSIPGNTIEEKYTNLKNKKLELLKQICIKLNQRFNLDLKPTRLVDDKIYVSSNISNISVKVLNDLILIEDNGILYSFDTSTGKYSNITSSISFKRDKKKIKRI